MKRIFYLAALSFAAMPALAQNPQPTSPANPTVPVAPPNAPAPPPEQIAPPDNGTMSNQLSKQRGTLTPPDVDPKMAVTPPASGRATTPVIPPPGSPGGNRSVVPK